MMKGQITIERTGRHSLQVRAHCRANSLATCNRTLSYNIRKSELEETIDLATDSLNQAGCETINTTNLL
jgi:hypothetical protein